jgi:hypothetical protein
VEFVFNGKENRWVHKHNAWVLLSKKRSAEIIRFNGTYEGILFYGARFNDSKKVDSLLFQGKIREIDI